MGRKDRTDKQPFFEMVRARERLHITLGSSFGRTLIAAGMLLLIAFRGENASGSLMQAIRGFSIVVRGAKHWLP
jgi:hypothetical protein